jgi:hypothetical protein
VKAESGEWKTFEFVFDSEQNLQDMRLDFFMPPVQEVYIDDVSLVEVTVTHNDTSDDAHILINKESESQNISCPDISEPGRCNQYIDLNDDPVTWPVTLAPYSSEIVIWEDNPFVE